MTHVAKELLVETGVVELGLGPDSIRFRELMFGGFQTLLNMDAGAYIRFPSNSAIMFISNHPCRLDFT